MVKLLPILTTGFGLGIGCVLGATLADRAEPGCPAPARAERAGYLPAEKSRGADPLAVALSGSSLAVNESAKGPQVAALRGPVKTKEGVAGQVEAPEASRDARVKARLGELHERAAKAMAAKNGGELLGVLRDLSILGKSGLPFATQVVDALAKMTASGTAAVDENALRRAAASGMFFTLYQDALANPQSYSPAFRQFAARELPWTDAPNLSAFYSGLLAREQDPLVAKSMADAVAQSHDPRNVNALVAAAFAQENAGTRSGIVSALAATPGDAAAQALGTLAASGPDGARESAANALQVLRSSAGGFLVTSVAPKSAAALAGVAIGDLLTMAQGKPFSSSDQLALLESSVRQGAPVLLTLSRGGRSFPALVHGGQLGIDGQFVAQTP
jgi:hypothetical protein